MTSKPQRNELVRLLSQACDEQLDDSEKHNLERLLQEDPGLIEVYTSFVANEAALEITCGKEVLELPSRSQGGDLSGQAIRVAPAVTQQGQPQQSVSGRSARRHVASTLRTFLPYALATSMVIAVGLWAVSRPRAYLASSDNAVWSDGALRGIGSPVRRDWLELASGEVSLAFGQGAQVSVRGPARFRAASSNGCQLQSGTLTAKVPEPAHGFTVDTPHVRVTDLGTSFKVRVDELGLLDCHVTEGEVRLRKNKTGQRLLAQAGDICALTDLDQPMTTSNSLRLRCSSGVKTSAVHPPSLGYNAFDHDDLIYVFLESHHVRLSEDLRVNVREPGSHTRLDASAGSLSAGSLVDCYLIHCAPVRRRHIVGGRISFPGEIVALICDSDSLNSTNTVLGARWTLQCTHSERGLESNPDLNSDVVTLSNDRRSLSLRLKTESIDQLRVLVAAD